MHPKRLLFRPAQFIALGFIAFVTIGSLLLSLPAASASGKSIAYIDALFTATSSVCVTGLSTLDVGNAFSTFGHVVIMLLMQVGALGFMTFATLVFVLMRRRIGLRGRILLREALNEDSLHGLTALVYGILKLSLLIEGVGALLFMTQFIPIYGSRGIFISIFHSVSSFCSAGLDIFGDYQSLAPFSSNTTVMLTTIALVVLGGLGFTVMIDVRHRKKKLTMHTRIVLKGTAILILGSAVFFIMSEWNNAFAGMPAGDRVLAGLFQSVTIRTVGFDTIDQSILFPHSKILSLLLMFIGGAPASTSGGIKITTFIVIIASVNSILHNRADVELGNRRIGKELVRRAAAMAAVAAAFVLGVSIALSISESASGFTFEQIFFEAFSSCSTVGISTGITTELNAFSKILIQVAMFFGKIGPFTLALALSGNSKPNSIRYPEDKLIIG